MPMLIVWSAFVIAYVPDLFVKWWPICVRSGWRCAG